MRPTLRLGPDALVSAELAPAVIGDSDYGPDVVLHVDGLDVVMSADVRDQLVDSLIDPDPGP